MPRVVDHAARRSEIVYALWAVIHEKGLDGVSFRGVAEQAGISIGRIQHYFGSKDELIREGCTQMVEAARTQYAAHSAGAGPERSLWELVASPIPSTQPQRLGAAVWYAYLATSVSRPELRRIIAGAVDDSRREATRLLRAITGAGGGDDAGHDEESAGRDGDSARYDEESAARDGESAARDGLVAGRGGEGVAESSSEAVAPSDRLEVMALGLLALGDGLAQRVVVGTMDGPEALTVLAEEFARHGLTPGGGAQSSRAAR